jgi:hypothetical protein
LSPNMDIVRKHKKTHFETHGLVFTWYFSSRLHYLSL